MALKLPDVTALGERPVARPNAPILASYNPAAPSGLPRQATAQLASSLAELGHEAQREQDRVDDLRAEEAFTALRDRQLDLTLGEKEGFMNVKGGAAVSRPTPLNKEYLQRFDQESGAIEGTLGTERQRLGFKKRAAVARGQFDEHLLRHMATEGDRYAKEVYDGTVDTETRSATANWDSQMDVGLSLERVRAAVEARADKLNWPPEYAQAELQKAQGKVHTAVVQQALASGNYIYAQQWYQQHKADIDLPTAKLVEKAVEDGTQKQLANGYQSEYLANENSQPTLEALRKRVLGDKDLGEDRRNILVGRIQNRQMVLEHRDEVAQTRRLNGISRALGELNGNTLAGFEPRADQFADVLGAAKGTELEPQVRQAMQLADATRTFRNQPPAVQERILSEAEAGVRQDPTKFDRRVVGAWRTIHDAQKRQLEASPVSYGVEQGFLPVPRQVDLSNPAQSADGIQDQISAARAMRERYGAPLKPLTPAQSDTMRSALQGASVAQKRQYFAGLAQAVGTDYDGYSAIMSQLAPDDPVTATAGLYAYRGRTAASDYMLRGQALLHPSRKDDGSPDKGKLWPMPADADLRKAFQSYEKDAFAGRGEARNNFEQASKAIYAAKSSEEGDASGVLNVNRWEESIRLATGGIEKYQGKAIVLPYGHSYSMFRDELSKRIDTVVESGRLAEGVTRAKVQDMPLEPVGDGLYMFKAGDGRLVDKNNRPIVVDFNTDAPFRTSGDRMIPKDTPPTEAETRAASKPATGRALQTRKKP